MVVLNQQFGFRLPAVGEVNSNINHGSQCNSSVFPHKLDLLCQCFLGLYHSHFLGFLGLFIVMGKSRGPPVIEAPHCISHVTPQNDISQSQAPHLTQQPLHISPQEDHRQSTTLEVPSLQLDEPMTLPPLNHEESDNPKIPPPCPTGLWHTVSFYDTPFDRIRLHGHTLSVVPDEDENYDPTGEGNYSDPPIDEALPSEDDHFAESVLQGGKAKPIFLPILNTQVRWNVVQIPTTQGMTHPPSAMLQLLGGVNPPILPVGPAIQGAKPWQIQFYKPVVQDVLERMKQFSYCNVASINSFPLCAHFNIKAIEYMEEVISERQSQGLPISDGWWPHYVNDICKLLWESLGNWRLALRKKAHIYVTQYYKWNPENHHEVNSGIVKDLFGDCGAFLRDGIDENGYMNNLAHPALAGLIVDFFYTSSSSSLSKPFPEVFSAEVPRVAVAIAATVLKVILNEMVSLQNEVNFRVGTYTPVYLEILGLMKKCDTSVIHAKKTKSL
ncbi:hypothetical protein EDC04DRAFT_2898154 [Pisolithus marmoratus]|nr:hypothetical protein EDC04DRAFT_2898154 [Pisolithus marmoratus]